MNLFNINSSEIDEKYADLTHQSQTAPILSITFAICTALAAVGNAILLIYIVMHKLYKNFISSHFIAHLCCTNLVALMMVMPIFIYTVWTGDNLFEQSHFMCKVQVLTTCTVWMVITLMGLCIAGVHLLTFARIHYEQLFGLAPSVLCGLSWLISLAVATPAITNGHIVIYDANLRYCIWSHSDSGLKFLTYIVILGIVIPGIFSSHAYIRVLGILYHSPIVFQSLGLYKSRFLVYAFLISPLYQVPFFVMTMIHEKDPLRQDFTATWPAICTFVAFTQCFLTPILYGASLFMIKEEDMALTARTHQKNTHHQYQHIQTHQIQAQLI